MNNIVKYGIFSLLGIIVILFIVYLKLFIIGNSEYDSISINSVVVSNSNVVIDGYYTDSGRAYKDYSYILVGKELYVEVKSTLVSSYNKSGSFSISISVNGLDIDNIHLTNNKSTKVIYSK